MAEPREKGELVCVEDRKVRNQTSRPLNHIQELFFYTKNNYPKKITRLFQIKGNFKRLLSTPRVASLQENLSEWQPL